MQSMRNTIFNLLASAAVTLGSSVDVNAQESRPTTNIENSSQTNQSALEAHDKEANIAAYNVALSLRPHDYKVLKTVVKNSSGSRNRRVETGPYRNEIQYSGGLGQAMRMMRIRDEEIRNAGDEPSLSIGLGSSRSSGSVGLGYDFTNPDKALRRLQIKHRQEDFQIQADMLNDREMAQKVYETIFTIENKRRNSEVLTPKEKNIAIVLDALKERNEFFPRNAATREAIIGVSQMKADVLAQIEAAETPEEKRAIINNTYQVTNILNFTQIEQNNRIALEIKRERGVEDPELQLEVEREYLRLNSNSLTDEQRKLQEEKINALDTVVRARYTREHQARVAEAYGYANASYQAAILIFGPSEDLAKAFEGVNITISMYNAVGDMAINGLTSGGVGTVLAGINAIAGIGGPSENEVQIEMLGQILEGLQALDQKLDIVLENDQIQNAKLDYLIDAVDKLSRNQAINFVELNAKMDFYYDSEEARDRLLGQRSKLQAARDGITEYSANFGPTGLGDDLFACQNNFNACSKNTKSNYFTPINNSLNRIATTITDDLVNEPIFQQDLRTPKLLKGEAEVESYASNSYTEDRVGLFLEKLVEWLNENDGDADNNIVNTVRFQDLPHPFYLHEALGYYREGATRLPAYYGRSGKTDDVKNFESLVDDLDEAAQEMRLTLGDVRDLYVMQLKRYLDYTVDDIGNQPFSPFFSDQILEDYPNLLAQFFRPHVRHDNIVYQHLERPQQDIDGKFIADDMGFSDYFILGMLISDKHPGYRHESLIEYLRSDTDGRVLALGKRLGLLTTDVRNETKIMSPGSSLRTDENTYIVLTPHAKRLIAQNKMQGNSRFKCLDKIKNTFPGNLPSDSNQCNTRPLAYMIASYFDYHRNQIRDKFLTKTGHKNMRRNIALSKLAIETFIDGGYGSDNLYLTELSHLGQMLSILSEIERHLDALRDGRIQDPETGEWRDLSLGELRATYKEIGYRIHDLNDIDLTPVPEEDLGITLGWGNIDAARDHIDTIREYTPP